MRAHKPAGQVGSSGRNHGRKQPSKRRSCTGRKAWSKQGHDHKKLPTATPRAQPIAAAIAEAEAMDQQSISKDNVTATGITAAAIAAAATTNAQVPGTRIPGSRVPSTHADLQHIYSVGILVSAATPRAPPAAPPLRSSAAAAAAAAAVRLAPKWIEGRALPDRHPVAASHARRNGGGMRSSAPAISSGVSTAPCGSGDNATRTVT
eukprot:358848-Chlamydomonas_euryale.AAC.1